MYRFLQENPNLLAKAIPQTEPGPDGIIDPDFQKEVERFKSTGTHNPKLISDHREYMDKIRPVIAKIELINWEYDGIKARRALLAREERQNVVRRRQIKKYTALIWDDTTDAGTVLVAQEYVRAMELCLDLYKQLEVCDEDADATEGLVYLIKLHEAQEAEEMAARKFSS